jgi:hypothetical protein
MRSYAQGPKGTVVRKTIGEAFLETANRFADRVALISVHQNIRLNWAEYAQEAHRVAAGLRAAWIASRRPRRSVGGQLRGVADSSIRLRAGWRCPGKRESRQPLARVVLCVA